MLHATPFGYKNGAESGGKGGATEADKSRALQPTAMATASGAYMIASAERGRSAWRIDGLNYTFKAHVVPYFGEATPITDITPQMVENFISSLKRKGLKNKTVKNIIMDVRAMFNWATEEGANLCSRNPVTKEVAKLISNTRVAKAPINRRWFDIAAQAIENKLERAWFDVTRYLGMRKDESNRLQWSDINWNAGKVRIPGTKTDEAEQWLAVAPVALKTLRELYEKHRS
jgi:integrase